MKAVVFDFDGVIANSLALVVDAANGALREMGLPQNVSADDIRNLPVMEWEVLARTLSVESVYRPEFVRNCLRCYSEEASELDCYPGIPELISHLSKSSPLGIVTGNGRVSLERFLQQRSLAQHFRHLLTYEDGVSKAAKLVKMAELLELSPADLIYIGDSVSDVEACKASGVYSVAAAWGNQRRELLQRAEPDRICNSVDELSLLFALERL